MTKTVTIDLTAYDSGKPNWLSPVEQNRPRIEALRAAKRAERRAAADAAVKLEKWLKDRE
jgi:hypothetical protein